MAPRVEGLSVRQTQALRVLALGGQAMRLGRTKIRFTTTGGAHVDLPFVAVKERLLALGLVKDFGGGTYLITPKGQMLSDMTARAYREEWDARVAARKAYDADWRAEMAASPGDFAESRACDICNEPLTESQIKRGARHCGGGCRAKAFEARNPRLYDASIEQLEGELQKRLGKAAGRAEDRPVTVRALTRNVRVLKLTWVKLRSMTPSGKTFMQTLEKLVHEAWLGREGT